MTIGLPVAAGDGELGGELVGEGGGAVVHPTTSATSIVPSRRDVRISGIPGRNDQVDRPSSVAPLNASVELGLTAGR